MSDHAAAIRGLRRWHPDPLVHDTINRIRACGWAVTAVSGVCEVCAREPDGCQTPACSFAYTSGLVLHDIPELAVYGLDAWTSREVLNELGDIFHTHDWRDTIDRGVAIELSSLSVPVRLIEMIDKDDLIITNELFPDAAALQAVWPDEGGLFPWDEGYSLGIVDQDIKGIEGTGAHRVRGPRVITPGTAFNRARRRP